MDKPTKAEAFADAVIDDVCDTPMTKTTTTESANGDAIDSWLEPSKYLKQEHQVVRSIIRRITPKECCRLMFIPEDHPFVDGPETSDSSVYRSQGNGWARNQSRWVFKRQHLVDEKFVTGHRKQFKIGTISSGQGTHELSVTDFGDISLFSSEIDQFVCRVLAARFPDTVNFGDMTRIDYDAEKGLIHNRPYEGYEPMSKEKLGFTPVDAEVREIPLKYGELDVLSGGTPCVDMSVAGKRQGAAEGSGTRSALSYQLPRIGDALGCRWLVWENVCFGADTWVTTDKGHKIIADVRVGDKVRSFDGKFHAVENVFVTPNKETVRLTVMGADPIDVTPNHPFYARVNLYKYGDHRRSFSKPEWITAGELTKKHFIGYKLDAVGTKSIGMANAYAVGRWLADGSYALRDPKRYNGKHGGQCARIFISTGWKKHDALLAELSRLPYSIRESKIKDYAINFTFMSDAFYELIKDCGMGARNKKVPEYVYSLKPEEQAELLRGYLDGDGHRHKANEMTYCSSSRELAMGIARLVRDIYHRGVSIRHQKGKGTTTIEGRTVRAHDFWYCSFGYGIINDEGKTHLMSFVEDGIVWCPVRKVEAGDKQNVYNLTVKTTHTYEANDVIVHNCGALNSNGGKDIGWFLYRVMQAGYTIAWRTLDAQVTFCDWAPRAVPQRRMRIWMVAYRGDDWRIPCRVLFEPMKALGTEAPRRVVGKGFTTTNPEFNPAEAELMDTYRKKKGEDDGSRGDLFSMFFGEPEPDDYAHYKRKVLHDSDLELQFPDESDITKVKHVDLYQFVRTVGMTDKGMYVGDLFNKGTDWQNGNVTPDDLAKGFLENVGTAGLLSKGVVATFKAPTWTAGLTEEELAGMDEVLRDLYDGTVSGLADVLDMIVDGKYRLSWRACWGIIVRAETREKELPQLLEDALLWQIAWNPEHIKFAMLNSKREEDRMKAGDCWRRVIEPNADLYNCSLDEIMPEPIKKANGDADDGEDEEADEAEDSATGEDCGEDSGDGDSGDEV